MLRVGRRGSGTCSAFVLAVLALAAPLEAEAAQGSSVATPAEQAVTYRRHVMKSMGEQAAALGLVLQQKGPAENAALHARSIALNAEAALRAFELKAPGGEAKAEIWRNWPDFLSRMKALAAGASELALVAEREGLSAVQAKAMTVLTCKSCHDAYTLRRGR